MRPKTSYARPVRLRSSLWALAVALSVTPAAAQSRRVEITLRPTARAQLAIWIQSEDGSRFATLGLTQSIAHHGIGNRPGALQMNSGFDWPYGRREGALPIWAHRRVAAGGEPFQRVIFNGRISEGNASSAGSFAEPANTTEPLFCLSFDVARSGRDALDAVGCPSRFYSNKGRYLAESDLASGYAEPFEGPGRVGTMRPLSLDSLYPPRRDEPSCQGTCGDHSDVSRYAADVRRIMPEIDAITMATPAGDAELGVPWDVPADWPEGPYVVFVEVNVEGDYNSAYDAASYPTPVTPPARWDGWAIDYGYAYRGQPAILFTVPFELRATGGSWVAVEAAGYGALHGEDGDVRPLDPTITDDPTGAPGSGTDRLRRAQDGARVRVVVPMWDVCAQPEPPPMCGEKCARHEDCGADLLCRDHECVGMCDVLMQPAAIESIEVVPHREPRHSHRWGHLAFRAPSSQRRVTRYEVRVGTRPIVDTASFLRALPANEASLEPVGLRVPADAAPGERIEVDFGGLSPETRYYVGVRAVDECNAPGPIASAELLTTQVNFTTVSPCFVASAAYGSPLEPRVRALRRLRDRHLRTNAIGRATVTAYQELGPHLASAIREHPELRSAARLALEPIVWLAERAAE